jgi:hypothetical protein
MEKTKKFWKLAMRHFGGKFIRFMTGFINTSDIVFQTARKEQCDPNNTDVNFAVPSEQILRNFNPYGLSGSKRYPGIYTDVSPGLGIIKHLKLRISSNLKIESFDWYMFHLRRKLRKSSIGDVL